MVADCKRTLIAMMIAMALTFLMIPSPTAATASYRTSVDTMRGSVWLRFNSGWELVTPKLLRLKKGFNWRQKGATNGKEG